MDETQQDGRFLLRNSHRKLLKKTMMNTQAKWLSSFLNQEMQPASQENCFSKPMKIHPKASILLPQKKIVPERTSVISQSHNLKEILRPHHNHSQNNRYLLNFENKRVRFPTEGEIGQENRLRNTTVFSHKLHHRSLLERESRKSVTDKLKTEPTFMEKTIKVKNKKRKEKEFLLLSPWGLNQENKENILLLEF